MFEERLETIRSVCENLNGVLTVSLLMLKL